MDFLLIRGCVICIIFLETYFVAITKNIRYVNWPTVLVIGFLVGSGISRPIRFALDPLWGQARHS